MSRRHDRLMEDITAMMTDPSQAADTDKIERIIEQVRKLKPNRAPDNLRLAATHFMTMYHTRQAMQMGSADGMDQMQMGGPGGPPGGGSGFDLEKLEEFKQAQRQDMELGWELLQVRTTQSSTAKTARVLKIEVAQRLEDSHRLREAYEDLTRHDLTQEEIMVAFTAAPFVGDYRSMMRLGAQIERQPGGMEQLHMMSLQLPIPDFTIVYDLVKEHGIGNNPTPDPSELVWDLISVTSIRVRFRDVNCGEFEEKREELLAEIQKQETVWEDVPNVEHVHLKRMGALTQGVSFGELPIMLNGPTFDSKIHLRGRAEMPMMPDEQMAQLQQMSAMGMAPNMDNMVMLVQTEEWDLVLSENSNGDSFSESPDDGGKPAPPKCKFVGTYQLQQKPLLPPGKKPTPDQAPVYMTFDCQIVLERPLDGAQSGAVEESKDNDGDEEEANQPPADEALVTEFDGLELE